MKRSWPRDDTAFFGRGSELEAVAAATTRSRLVTIVGLGGIGKTRLALAAIERLALPRTAFVALDGVKTLEAATRAIATAVGRKINAESKAADALATLGDALAKHAQLLVFDGVESLADARVVVRELLDRAPSLTIIVTAREPLDERGETKIALGALDPSSARSLFADRAGVALPGEKVEAVLSALDGIPLAIELAASRLEVLGIDELLGRITRVDVLKSAGGAMRATLEATWDVLAVRERAVLAEMAVFEAPFGIEAAEEIAGDEGDVLDVLESLLRKSLLVRVDEGGKARLGLYATVRQWAREKLGDPAVRARHRAHHLAEAERWAKKTYGVDGVAALDALGELLPELAAAFEEAPPAEAARIVLALQDLLLFRGLFELRSDLVHRGADAAERSGDRELLARALVAKARVTLEIGRMGDAEAELRRARELATPATYAEATRSLGWALIALARLDEAEAALQEAGALHREQGSARGIADVHVATGIVCAFRGNVTEALAHLREALAIHVERGDVVRQEKVLGFAHMLGKGAAEVARGLPRDVLARAPAVDGLPPDVGEVVAKEHEAGERWRQAIALYRTGAAKAERGAHVDAVAAFERATQGLARAGVHRGVAAIRAHTAVSFAELGDFAEADAHLELAKSAAESDAHAALTVRVFAAAIDVVQHRDVERALAAAAADDSPELTVARQTLRRLLAGRATPGAELRVGPEARWIEVRGGERLDLVRYGPVRRLLDRLVEARLQTPGSALGADALIEAGWPGERMLHSAGLLRVYSAIRRLRRLGLEDVLVTRDDGYLLDANADVVRT